MTGEFKWFGTMNQWMNLEKDWKIRKYLIQKAYNLPTQRTKKAGPLSRVVEPVEKVKKSEIKSNNFDEKIHNL